MLPRSCRSRAAPDYSAYHVDERSRSVSCWQSSQSYFTSPCSMISSSTMTMISVVKKTHVNHGLSLDTLSCALTTYDAFSWYPVTWLSHAIDCQIPLQSPPELTLQAFCYTHYVLSCFSGCKVVGFYERSKHGVEFKFYLP